MATFTEEVELDTTIKHRGDIEVREVIVVYKDGVEFARSLPHRSVVGYDEARPANVTSHINAKKGKQPTLPPQAGGNNGS